MKKTVIITGGGRRIGRGLAIEFGKKGWNVGIIYNKSHRSAEETARIIQGFGGKSITLRANVSNHDEISSAIKTLFDEFATVDLLINNAAIFPAAHSLGETSIDLWQTTLSTNLTSVYSASQAFAELAPFNSRIVNIASLGAYKIWKQRIPYNVSKSGVVQLTKALALELAPKIAVNSVSPGTIEMVNEPADAGPLIDSSRIPMKRYGNIDDIFDAVYFFATCSLFITGQDIIVDGGFSLV